MIALSPLSASTLGPVDVPPPAKFRPIIGAPRHAKFVKDWERDTHGITAAQKSGIRYEEKIQDKLLELFPSYRANPPISFYDGGGILYCIPDGVLQQPKQTFVFEIKFQHMPEAWWQLRKLYQPVVEAMNIDVPVHVVEICRTYDPATPFPEPVRLVEDLAQFICEPFQEFAVLRWK